MTLRKGAHNIKFMLHAPWYKIIKYFDEKLLYLLRRLMNLPN